MTDDNKIDVTAAVVGHQIFEHDVRIGNCTIVFFLVFSNGKRIYLARDRCAVGATKILYDYDGETNYNNNNNIMYRNVIMNYCYISYYEFNATANSYIIMSTEMIQIS